MGLPPERRMEGTVLETRGRGGGGRFFALYVSLGSRRDVARSVSDALIFVYPHSLHAAFPLSTASFRRLHPSTPEGCFVI